MHAIVLAAALAAQAPAPGSTAPSVCKSDQTVQTSNDHPLAPRPRARMPQATLMRAVLLTVGPCAMVAERIASGFGQTVWRMRPVGDAASQYIAPANADAKPR